jgi:hypothetical protein
MICKPKDQGGLGVQVLKLKTNACLASAYTSFSMKRVCGKRLYTINTFTLKIIAGYS